MSAADIEPEKRAAARAAAQLVRDGMRVGLGTGSTVAHLLPALAERGLTDLRCVATSPATEAIAVDLGLPSSLRRASTASTSPSTAPTRSRPTAGWSRAAAARTRARRSSRRRPSRFVVIASSDKEVDALAPPVPLELLAFGLAATLRAIGDARPRGWPASPDGGVIADLVEPFGDPAALSARLSAIPGVVDHGLFGPGLVTDVLLARGDAVEHRAVSA